MIAKRIMRNKWRLFLAISFQLAVIISFAQVNKAPAYPLVVHDPYFSIWSFTDKLNESVTRHWTGAEHSLLGLLQVDGTKYGFLGRPEFPIEILLAPGAERPFECKYTEDDPGVDWMKDNFDDSRWKTGKAPFGT